MLSFITNGSTIIHKSEQIWSERFQFVSVILFVQSQYKFSQTNGRKKKWKWNNVTRLLIFASCQSNDIMCLRFIIVGKILLNQSSFLISCILLYTHLLFSFFFLFCYLGRLIHSTQHITVYNIFAFYLIGKRVICKYCCKQFIDVLSLMLCFLIRLKSKCY